MEAWYVGLQGKDVFIQFTADGARELVDGINRALQTIEEADNPYK